MDAFFLVYFFLMMSSRNAKSYRGKETPQEESEDFRKTIWELLTSVRSPAEAKPIHKYHPSRHKS